MISDGNVVSHSNLRETKSCESCIFDCRRRVDKGIQYETDIPISISDELDVLFDAFYSSSVPTIGYRSGSVRYMNLKAQRLFPGWKEPRFINRKSGLEVDFSYFPEQTRFHVTFYNTSGEATKATAKLYQGPGGTHFCFLQDIDEGGSGTSRENLTSANTKLDNDNYGHLNTEILTNCAHRIAVCDSFSFKLLFQNKSFSETFAVNGMGKNDHNWLISLAHPLDRSSINEKIQKLECHPEHYNLMTRKGDFKMFNVRLTNMIGRSWMIIEISDVCNGMDVCPFLDSKELTDPLKKLASEADQISKSRFIATVSHEMRTPLTCLAGAISLLHTTELNEEQKDLVATLNFCSKTLNILINNILDYGKIREDQFFLEMKEFALDNMLKETYSLVSLQAQSTCLDLMIDINPRIDSLVVHSDEFRMKQVLLNLLTNAIKFTRPGGNVRLYVDMIQDQEEAYLLKFTVSDTGIGIPLEKHNCVFVPFSQFHDKSFGGTGLGLAISKQLVHKLGGQISFSSEKGKGSCFTFTVRQKGKVPWKKKTNSNATVNCKIGNVALYFLNPGMSKYIEMLLRDSFVIETCTQVKGESGLRAYIDSYKGMPEDLLIVEELVCLSGDFGRKVLDMFDSKVRWIHVGSLTSFQSPRFPRNFKKISKPFVSKDFIEMVRSFQNDIIPIAKNDGESMDDQKSVSKTGKQLRILVVDDNPTILTILKKFIQRCGDHIVEEATDGIYAVSAIESSICEYTAETDMYDIIIADMIMTTLNGDEATRIIRSMKCLKKQPHIVALTANVLADDKKTCLDAGMCDFVSKPVKIDVLKNILDRASHGTLHCTICNLSIQ